ncbi:MAG TPA: GAF domain-containing protein [Candidatus Eremiobacteraceae bacterium]|nr:GAF domain-containing protein [Candidatus Eremiobacteraceae bacterium]
MAEKIADAGRLTPVQAVGPLDDTRRNAAATLCGAAVGLLGCNVAEVYVFDEQSNAYVSLASNNDGDPVPPASPLPADSVDAFFSGRSDVAAIDDAKMLGVPFDTVAHRLYAASMLILRIGLERRPLGLIVCGYRVQRPLSAAGTATPNSFARVAATTLDLARRIENALDRADRLAALLDSAARFAGELDLEELFTAIHEEVARHMDAPSFFVALQSPDADTLRTEYAIEAGTRLHVDALPDKGGLAYRVFTTGQPVLLEPTALAAADPAQPPNGLGTVLIVPMRLGERIIGVMSAQSKLPNAYGQHHIEFLLEVAEQAATAIQNAGVLREERRRMAELAMLHRVAVLTSSEAQLDRIMAAVVVEAAAVFHADAASIALQNERGDFELAATFGLSEEYRKQRRLAGDALRELYGDPPKERFIGPDQLELLGQTDLVAAERIRNVFLIPLTYRGRLVGSLALHGRQSIVRLSSSEARLAQVFADQVAAAMHRAQDAQTLAERIEDYDVLTRVGHALVSSLDVHYEQILTLLRDQLGYSHLAIFSVLKDTGQLRLEASVGYPDAVSKVELKPSSGLVGMVASGGDMVYVADVRSDPRYLPATPEVRSLIAYPLKVQDSVLGVLSVESPQVDRFATRDRRLLATVADQVAIAVSNARQYAMATERLGSLESARAKTEEHARFLERRQEELQLVGEVGAAVSSTLNLNRMLTIAAEKTAGGMHAERCIISMYNEERTESEVAADYWKGGQGPSLVGARFPVRRDSKLLRLLAEQRALSTEDAQADERLAGNRQEFLEQGLRGCAIAAIRAEGQLIGNIVVGSTTEKRQFSKEQRGVLETIATQLALGVRNARLYERARERANEDSLTGLFNHRHLHGRLEQELMRAQRANQPLAIVLFDLNNFKAFNDNYGHQAGDEVLRFMATMLTQSLRGTDIAGRYGGDEFLVILPQSDEQGARLLLERVRRKIEEQAEAGFLPIPIELSAGIAVYPRDGENKRDLVARADAAMYADKRRPS